MVIIANKYQIIKELGEGSFGKVFECEIIKTKKIVAVKIQPKDCPNILKNEAKIYKFLLDTKGIPILYNIGIFDGFNYLVIEKFETTIENISISNNKKLEYFIESINILESIHEKGIIHRDIKPENIMIDLQKNIKFIDFGISKLIYINNNHITYKDGKKFIGTLRYSSLNSHRGIELTKRDDIESLIYSFMKIIDGKLPWDQYEDLERNDRLNKVMFEKEKLNDFTILDLLFILQYIKKLKFDEKPNYKYIIGIINNYIQFT